MEDFKHIVVKIAQDDKFDDVVERLNSINRCEETLYCAGVWINLFNKKKEEICPEDDIPPYKQEKLKENE